MNTYLHVLKNYAIYTGRSDRREFWIFALYDSGFAVIAIILDNLLGITIKMGYGPILIVYGLALTIPGLALVVRRLHDVGKSGWMMLIGFIPIVGTIWLIVLLAMKGDAAENQYGAPSEALADHPISDEIILAFVVWVFLTSLFYGILPRAIHDYYQTMTFQMAEKYVPIVSGAYVIALTFIVKNINKRILLIVISSLVLLYDFYRVILQYIH